MKKKISMFNGIPSNVDGVLSQINQRLTTHDAFGRLRTSHPETLFDSKQIFDNNPLLYDDAEVSGSGTTSTYSKPAARTRIAVSANTAGKRVRQSFMRFNYQPGKSNLILLSGKFGDYGAGIKGCIGYFDDDNGLFFTYDEGTLKVVRRTNVTETAVDNEVTSANWNVDKMDGTGASGITIDPTKTQIMFIDFEWLGIGRVRMGFVVGGEFITVHEFLNSNTMTEVYMSTPNLPARYSIENDGTGAAASLDHICSSVISEGGSQDLGVVRYKSTAGSSVTMADENTLYAIVGLKLKASAVAATIKILNIALQVQTASKLVEWVLLFNPSVDDTFTFSDETNSAVQAVLGASGNVATGGVAIVGGFIESTGVPSGGSGSSDHGIDTALRLGSKIDGTPDTIVLCARPIGGSSSVEIEGSISWRELS